MKYTLIGILALFCFSTYGQDKFSYVHFNKLTQVTGTEFVIATIDNRGKTEDVRSKNLLFVNTKSGETHSVDFPGDARIGKPEQVRIDSLGINLIMVAASTVDLDGKNGIGWNDPEQIIILSPDGKQKTQLTPPSYFVSTWAVNRLTGTLVVTGHLDTNKNNKYDKTDKNEIQVYNLKTLKLLYKI